MSGDLQQILSTAIEAARKSGKYLLDNWGKLDEAEVDEKRKNDFVTTVDRTSEEMIIEHILTRFPGHKILAEESGERRVEGHDTKEDYQWIIDPLDGTTNYIRHHSEFCVSIAAKYQKDLIVGVVFNPFREELFSAVKDRGAALNGNPIKISETNDFSRAFLATGFPHQSKLYLPQYINSFSEIFYHCAGVRRLGSAALDLCYTACGRFEGYWELNLNAWDLAAGSLLVQEAGGLVTDFWGQSSYLDSGFIIAGNPAIHARIKKVLSFYFQEEKNVRYRSR